MLSRPLQPLNAEILIVFMIFGIVMLVSPLQSQNAPLFNPVRTLIMKAQYLQSISILSVVRLINKPLILQPFSGTMIS